MVQIQGRQPQTRQGTILGESGEEFSHGGGGSKEEPPFFEKKFNEDLWNHVSSYDRDPIYDDESHSDDVFENKDVFKEGSAMVDELSNEEEDSTAVRFICPTNYHQWPFNSHPQSGRKPFAPVHTFSHGRVPHILYPQFPHSPCREPYPAQCILRTPSSAKHTIAANSTGESGIAKIETFPGTGLNSTFSIPRLFKEKTNSSSDIEKKNPSKKKTHTLSTMAIQNLPPATNTPCKDLYMPLTASVRRAPSTTEPSMTVQLIPRTSYSIPRNLISGKEIGAQTFSCSKLSTHNHIPPNPWTCTIYLPNTLGAKKTEGQVFSQIIPNGGERNDENGAGDPCPFMIIEEGLQFLFEKTNLKSKADADTKRQRAHNLLTTRGVKEESNSRTNSFQPGETDADRILDNSYSCATGCG